MDTQTPPTDDELAAMRTALARHAHDYQWSGWKRYEFGKCYNMDVLSALPKGHLIIPPEWVQRWARQMNTPFDALPADEQKSDYAEADAVMALPEIKALLDEVARLRKENAMLVESRNAWQRSSAWATGVLEFMQANADLFGIQAGDWLMPQLGNVLARWVEAHRAEIEALK